MCLPLDLKRVYEIFNRWLVYCSRACWCCYYYYGESFRIVPRKRAIGKVEFLVLPGNNLFISYRPAFKCWKPDSIVQNVMFSIDGPDEILITTGVDQKQQQAAATVRPSLTLIVSVLNVAPVFIVKCGNNERELDGQINLEGCLDFRTKINGDGFLLVLLNGPDKLILFAESAAPLKNFLEKSNKIKNSLIIPTRSSFLCAAAAGASWGPPLPLRKQTSSDAGFRGT